MEAIEFNAKISKGIIEVPEQYRSRFNAEVKVILLKKSESIQEKTHEAKAFGMLSHRANSLLWEEEEKAWGRAVIERYDRN